MSDSKHPFRDDAEISALVAAFESCCFHPSEFKHYQHLAVALWYVSNFPYDEAAERMKDGIRKLASTYGKSGYHETITLFWLDLVRNFVASTEAHCPLAELANRLVNSYGDKTLINDYYSTEVLHSELAKTAWIEPDLKPMSFEAETRP